jgi:hypothetical protein
MAQRAQTMHYNEGQPFLFTVDVNGRTTARFDKAFLHAPGLAKIEWILLNSGTVPKRLRSGEVVLLLILRAVTSTTPRTVPDPLVGLEITLRDSNLSLPPIIQPPIQPVVLSTQPGPCDFCPEPPEDERPKQKKKGAKPYKSSSKSPRSQ